MNDIFVRYIKLPVTVHGYTATDENDDYNVYINDSISILAQEKAKEHELLHITQNHCFDNDTVKISELDVLRHTPV